MSIHDTLCLLAISWKCFYIYDLTQDNHMIYNCIVNVLNVWQFLWIIMAHIFWRNQPMRRNKLSNIISSSNLAAKSMAKPFRAKCATSHWKLPICYEMTKKASQIKCFSWNQFTRKKITYMYALEVAFIRLQVYRNVNWFVKRMHRFPA